LIIEVCAQRELDPRPPGFSATEMPTGRRVANALLAHEGPHWDSVFLALRRRPTPTPKIWTTIGMMMAMGSSLMLPIPEAKPSLM
jgi:hypothetical protein